MYEDYLNIDNYWTFNAGGLPYNLMTLGYNQSRRILLYLMTILFFGCQTNENNANDFKNLKLYDKALSDYLRVMQLNIMVICMILRKFVL